MKWLFILIIVPAIYLVIPRYDLFQVVPSFEGDAQLATIETNFFSRERCRASARELRLDDYRCVKRRAWDGVFTNYRKYNYEPARADARD